MITSTLKKMRPQRPHLAVLVVLLVCSFAMTGVIAYHAVVAASNDSIVTTSSIVANGRPGHAWMPVP